MAFYDYTPRGGAKELFGCRDKEILLQGPAGTGKSVGAQHYLLLMQETFPNTRVLFARKTRASMSETTLATWEDKVLPPDHPCLTNRSGVRPKRQDRSVYPFPNGSMTVCAGLDQATRLFSSEYSFIYVNEANELTLEEWESLHRALREKTIPRRGMRDSRGHQVYLRQLIGDCNPDSDQHWLFKRRRRMENGQPVGKTTWLTSRHEDNPSIDDDYMAGLEMLTGVRYKRLKLGIWCAAEGSIWENFDRGVHVIQAPRHKNGKLDRDALDLQWFFGSIDWGTTAAGTFQVWGVDSMGRMVLVEETYRTNELLDWWAEVVQTAYREYDLRVVVADPANKGNIEQMNAWLGPIAGRDTPWLVEEANNSVLTGLDQVRWGLNLDAHGVPRIRMLADAQRYGVDEDLRKRHLPTCLVEEIPEYVFRRQRPGAQILRPAAYELPDPLCQDHGCDAMRYAAMFSWGRNLESLPDPKKYPVGSHGHLLGHEAAWRSIRRDRGYRDDDDDG